MTTATNPTKLYVVAGVLVEGTRSEGGAFYDIKVVKTGLKRRYLAKIFEQFAKEVKCQKSGHQSSGKSGTS